MDYIYDVETYPNCFTLTLVSTNATRDAWQYVISDTRDDSATIKLVIAYLRQERHRMVGFNNINFDYPIVHLLFESPHPTAALLHAKANEIIGSSKPWAHTVPKYQRHVEQVDLFKIHHFDNPSKRTGLKDLEFNMRSENIEPLPFEPNTFLTEDQVPVLLSYNLKDCMETFKFYEKSKKEIEFRERISEEFNQDHINNNDVKIGVSIVVSKLEAKKRYICYGPNSRPKQTRRDSINVGECIHPSIKFETGPLNQVLRWLKEQTITDTKKVFTKLQSSLGSVVLKFGTGGIHGAVNFMEYHEGSHEIVDIDVRSYYPSIAVNYKLFPEHLGTLFCDIYAALLAQRTDVYCSEHESKTYKLALNGVFGNSNSPYSAFYDPKFTMSITLNGQLLMCMLCERILSIKGVHLIQVNTDGATFHVPKDQKTNFARQCKFWQKDTNFFLTAKEYQSLFIRDVNNYIGITKDDKIIRKGEYNYKKEWHQDHSALVIPKAVEAHLLRNVPLADYIDMHNDIYDFMLRVKLTREKKLIYTQPGDSFPTQLHNFMRYYVSEKGGTLQKIMPPLKGKSHVRTQAIESGWFVTPCNDINQAVNPINKNYYLEKAESLTLPMRPFDHV